MELCLGEENEGNKSAIKNDIDFEMSWYAKYGENNRSFNEFNP